MTNKRLLDEIALAGPEHLDAADVAGYERKAAVDPTADLEELRARGLGPATSLIDFGAGTGVFALAAASVCERVIAVDVSPAMVAAITEKVAERGATNVECVQAGFSIFPRQKPASQTGWTRRQPRAPRTVGRATSLRHTFARNTAPSAGCSNR